MLRYLPSIDTVFFMDPAVGVSYRRDGQCNLFAYSLDHAYLDYQCAVVLQDFDLANSLLSSVSLTRYNDLARFLDEQGFTEGAIQLASDKELCFDFALKLGNVDVGLWSLIDR